MKSLANRLKEAHSAVAEVCRRTLEPALYTAGIRLYAAGVKCAALWMPKARLMIEGHRHTKERLKAAVSCCCQPRVWVHAASLGEFEQGRPLIEEIRRRRPDAKIVLSFFSPSGYEVRKDWNGADAVVYLPFDTPGNVRRFLDAVRPDMAFFIKYEFWRNYLYGLWNRHIPTYLVSAVFRPEQAFFKRRSAWYRYWLRLYSRIYVQDERSVRLLDAVGIRNVEVVGDTRFDRVTDIMNSRREIPALQSFAAPREDGSPVMVVGSSWPADEEVYRDWVTEKGVRTVIAPHEFDSQRLYRLCREFPDAVLYSQVKDDPARAATARTLIIDCFGLLSSAYAYGDMAYVGGGFGAGLHNINEAAVYGIPVIYGPNNHKFIEAHELVTAGGGFPVASREEFCRVATALLDEGVRRSTGEKAAAYIRSKLGATRRICDDIF